MKTKIYSLLVAILAFFTACSDKNDVFVGDWEGEYVATDVIEYLSPDGNVVSSISHDYPITIFRDKNLYVQTLGQGDPFDPKKDPLDHTIVIRMPSRINNTTLDDIEEEEPEPEEGGIENVEVTPKNRIVLIDGGVYSLYNGRMYASKAIRVLSSTENKLILRPGKAFDVALVTADGQTFIMTKCNWTYSPIKKTNDTYSWEAVLHMTEVAPDGEKFNAIRHTFTMSKK